MVTDTIKKTSLTHFVFLLWEEDLKKYTFSQILITGKAKNLSLHNFIIMNIVTEKSPSKFTNMLFRFVTSDYEYITNMGTDKMK